MDNYLTLLASIVIGGLMLINFVSYQAELRDHTFLQTSELAVQQTAMELIEIVKADLRQIGKGVSLAPFAVYDSSAVAFFADLGNNGVIDTVRYSVSNTGAASNTTNPNDRIFYRTVNGETQADAIGVTNFKVKFYNAASDVTTDLFEVKSIEVTLELENTVAYDDKYLHYFWRERITPANLLPL